MFSIAPPTARTIISSPAKEVLPSKLWIGSTFTACDLAQLDDLKIRALVNLSPEAFRKQIYYGQDFSYQCFPILDGAADNDPLMLKLAIASVVNLMQLDLRTIVTCNAGLSRSPCIAAAAIAIFNNLDLNTAMKIIASSFQCDISPALWHSTSEVYKGVIRSNATK